MNFTSSSLGKRDLVHSSAVSSVPTALFPREFCTDVRLDPAFSRGFPRKKTGEEAPMVV